MEIFSLKAFESALYWKIMLISQSAPIPLILSSIRLQDMLWTATPATRRLNQSALKSRNLRQ